MSVHHDCGTAYQHHWEDTQHHQPQSQSPCVHPLACHQVLKIGQTAADFAELSDEECASVSVLLNCGVGANAGKAKDIQVRCWLLGGDE